jgi:hypothetical protein
MTIRNYLPASAWVWRTLTGRTARRVYLSILLLLFIVTVVAHVYSFVLTRRIHAVILGLSRITIDQTTEEEVLRTVPYLVRSKWDGNAYKTVEVGDVDTGVEHYYYVIISNEANWMRFERLAICFSKVGYPRDWILKVGDQLGYRYLFFSAEVMSLDGKVSRISYGIADQLAIPRGIGNIVSVRSAHGFWAPLQTSFEVASTDEESPQFRVGGDGQHLTVSFAFDASPTLRSGAFQVDLSCFWSLFGCRHASQIAPLLWQDKITIEAATVARLKSSEPCPNRILAGRARYLPDMNILLLESTGSRVENVNEDGRRVDEFWTHYKLVEVLRGRAWGSWESVRSSATVLYPGDYRRSLPNMGLRWSKAGERVLAFSNMAFDSCQIVPATPTALSAIRDVVPAPRRAEDELVRGLL